MNTYKFIKRFFDIIFALLGILICFPFLGMLVIILLAKGENQPLFRQQRVGKNGRLFTLYKLRTIKKNKASLKKVPLLSTSNDNQVTSFCQFLRNTKIDEFPQFINVLNGDLSFIGPRPLVPEIFYGYPPDIQKDILTVKPGLSGMGSLVFRNENQLLKKIPKKDQLDFYHYYIGPQKGELEKYYVENQGPWTDLKILVLTPCVLLCPNFNIPKGWFKRQEKTIELFKKNEETSDLFKKIKW